HGEHVVGAAAPRAAQEGGPEVAAGAHVRAVAPPRLQNAGVLEGAYRFPDGVAPHAQRRDELGFRGDLRPDRPLAGGDERLELGDHLVAQAAGPHCRQSHAKNLTSHVCGAGRQFREGKVRRIASRSARRSRTRSAPRTWATSRSISGTSPCAKAITSCPRSVGTTSFARRSVGSGTRRTYPCASRCATSS